MSKKKVIVLGASGTIGKNTLAILEAFPEDYVPVAVSVHTRTDILEEIQQKFPNAKSCVTSNVEGCYGDYRGIAGLEKMLFDVDADIVVNGISGMPGLLPSIYSLKAGKDLALANKESLVMAGALLKKTAQQYGKKILPVDSEHSAVFQLLQGRKKEDLARIILTASGGPFRNSSREELATVTLVQACAHPTWKMGQKISIDSATLANKALEVIEAVQLFDVPADKISVVVHPQSVIHSMIQSVSGETYAQMSPPNMQNPIAFALAYPNSAKAHLPPLDFARITQLSFEQPRYNDFPLLALGFEVAKKAASYPIAFNAANEEAVKAFCDSRISFLDIARSVENVLREDWSQTPTSFEDVFAIDKEARIVSQKQFS